MLILGIILLAAAGGLVFWSLKAAGTSLEMQSLETSTVAQLVELATQVGQEIGPGSFHQRVELKGTLSSPQPVQGELGHQDCARFTTRVYRKFEEHQEHRQQDGTVRHDRVTKEELVSEISKAAPVVFKDATGQLPLDLDGGSVESIKTVDRFEPVSQAVPTTLAGVLREAILSTSHHTHTLGYRYVEEAVPLGRAVYILGDVSDAGGTLRIHKGKGNLTVSLKSEEQLLQGNRTTVVVTRIAAALVGLGGLAATFKALTGR